VQSGALTYWCHDAPALAVPFLVPLVAAVPAILVLVLDIARHEKHFRHEKLFFGLVAGILAGFILVVAQGLFLTDAGTFFATLAVPLVAALVLTMVIGLPRFRGDPASVWYGGGMGLAMAALVLLGEAQPVASRLSAGESFAAFAASSVGITGTFYATGMLVGWGSSRNTIVRMAPMAYLLLLPAAFFKGELDVGETAPFQGALLWAVLLLAYGVGAAVFAARRGHEYALPEAAKRARRRARREKMREE